MRRALALALLVFPGGADAATRYVAPGGAASGACERSAPCTPEYAIAGDGSVSGDTVVVLPGSYDIPPLVVGRALRVSGLPDRPRPVLRSAAGVALTIAPEAASTIVEHVALRASGEGALGIEVEAPAVIDDVRVTSAGAPCLHSDAAGLRVEDSSFTLGGSATTPCLETTGNDTTWEHVTVTALNGSVAARFVGNGHLTDVDATGRLTGLVLGGSPEVHRLTVAAADRGLVLDDGDAMVTDSVAIARQGGTAVLGRGGSHYLINLTAWGRGKGSAGVRAANGAELTVKNTIAHGTAFDLVAEPATTTIAEDCALFTGCPAGSLTVDHSNFRRSSGIVDNGANQSASPRFVDAEFEDFRLRPGSPAVDAGSFEINAASADRSGRFRWLGRTPDLGAFEYAPPRRLAPRRDKKAPILRAVALSSPALAANRRGTAFSAARRAATAGPLLRWFLSEKADIVITLRRPGRDQPVVGTIVEPAKLGWGSLRLAGRIDRRPLPRGRYVLRVLARDVTQNLSAAKDFAVRVN